jgi:hypothetical protein
MRGNSGREAGELTEVIARRQSRGRPLKNSGNIAGVSGRERETRAQVASKLYV